jgi:pSer/pThr/pTyr-binding forkhead associated (FHA) protein
MKYCPQGCADPGNGSMCGICASDLTNTPPPPPRQDTPPPAEEAPTPPSPAGDGPGPERSLLLVFPAGRISVAGPGDQVRLGRDERWSPHARLFVEHGNVSRKHATIGLDSSGRPWVRAEFTTNGTFLNGDELFDERPHPLRDGDRIRLAKDAEGVVSLGETPP